MDRPSIAFDTCNSIDFMNQSLDFTLEIEGRIEGQKLKCYVNNISSYYTDYLNAKRDNIINTNIFNIKDELIYIYYDIVNHLFDNPSKDSINIYIKKEDKDLKVVRFEEVKEDHKCWHIMAYPFRRNIDSIKVFIVIRDKRVYLNKVKAKKIRQDIKNYNDKIKNLSDIISNLSHVWRQPLNSLNFSIINLIDEIDSEEELDVIDKYYNEIWEIIKSLSMKIEKFKSFFEMDYKKIVFDMNKYLDLVFEIMDEKIKKDHIKVILNKEGQVKKYGSPNEFVQIMYFICFDIVGCLKNRFDIYNRKLNIKIKANKSDVCISINLIYDIEKYMDFNLHLNHLSMFKNIIENKMRGTIDLINDKKENKVIISFPLEI
ncbi:sensor histidine kinase [Clostridiisalibacter paucivorans]|uniref:sensor histidine kinase n=1 Tax=Clostridiisalibacter paucivorans TaxID=408753 RepID=UPI0012EC8E47|nr:sensor histidine kinase [Clostridiisalibacter paucivorans]